MINLMMWTLISLIAVVLISHAWNTQDAIDNKKYVNEYDLIIADSIESHSNSMKTTEVYIDSSKKREVNKELFITIDNSIKYSKLQKSKLELYPMNKKEVKEIEFIVA